MSETGDSLQRSKHQDKLKDQKRGFTLVLSGLERASSKERAWGVPAGCASSRSGMETTENSQACLNCGQRNVRSQRGTELLGDPKPVQELWD